MAGTLVISTLSDGTNSTSSTNCIQGSAKAWVYFFGGAANTAGSIQGSYNVSSITVNGTGDYTLNFTNALADGNYCWAGSASQQGSSTGMAILGQNIDSPLHTSTQLKVYTLNTSSSTTNATSVQIAVFR